jgi:hypothetical protein
MTDKRRYSAGAGNAGLMELARSRGGREGMKDFFSRLADKFPKEAAALINDESTSFPSLYMVKHVVEEKGLPDVLNKLSREAFDFVDRYGRLIGAEENDGANITDRSDISDMEYSRAEELERLAGLSLDSCRWILKSGLPEDGLDDRFDEILDAAAIVLMKVHRDKASVSDVVSMIFKRNRRGSHYHDLVWALFEHGDTSCLDFISKRLCSHDPRDVQLARKLLDFIPCFTENVPGNAPREYAICRKWLDENRKSLYYTGESFQQTHKPVPFRVAGKEKPGTGVLQ